jgi:hypothetical protein
MGGRALTACEEDVRGPAPDVVVNDFAQGQIWKRREGGRWLISWLEGRSRERIERSSECGRQGSVWLSDRGYEREEREGLVDGRYR